MDSYASIATATSDESGKQCLPESNIPLTFPSEPALPGPAICSAAPLVQAEETQTTGFLDAGEKAADGAQDNQRKRHPFGARGRAQFRGRNGRARSRWGVGGRGKFNRYPSRVDSGAINFHGSDSRHEKSTIVDSSGQQLVAPEVAPTMNLSTTGADATTLEPTAVKVYLIPQVSLLPLTWCDICRVDCNSVEVLEKHRTGKRHRRTLLLLEQLEGRLKMIEGLAANDHIKPEQHSKSVDVPTEDMKGTIETLALNETIHIKPDAGTSLKRKRKRNSEPEQPRVCVLCNAACNSLAMFESHLAGKKHAARITRLQSPNTVYGPTSACIPPNQSTLSDQETQPLYYGLVNCEEPQACSVLNPHLEQEYEHKEHEPPSEC